MRRRRGRVSGVVDMARSYVTPFVGACVALFLCVFAFRAHGEWNRIENVPVGAYSGLATVVGDPEPRGVGVSVVLRVEGWRYEAILHGADAWRVRNRMQGESVLMSATRQRWGEGLPRYKLVRHVAGRLVDVNLGGDWTQGSALTRATNRLRRLIAHGASALPRAEGSLLVGLVIGDDRAQPRGMRTSFRDAGLSHLTAVSGQNIVFVLAVFSPAITRMKPRARLVATLGVLAAFTLMTRAEPSVLRAGGMAGLSAVVFAAGGKIAAGRALLASSAVLVIADPFLAWSVGYWLSFAATAGLVVVGPQCESLLRQRLRCPGFIAAPLAASFAAQLATLPILVVVFGRVAPWGLVANLFAVPVAGAVMLAGLPLCLVAGLVGQPVASLLTAPLLLGVRWVWWVAEIVARLPA
ncbi:MAG: ComEC/Rec2 family competence protein [Actinobacteria bacterium]|nr:ComEC/Rec2 family competence protein [Actinomycetota bacterium]